MNRPQPEPAEGRPLDAEAIVADARAILAKEIAGMEALAAALDGSLAVALALIEARVTAAADGRRGRLVVTGVGKSGHIGAKLASTFASTGTPSFYLHAAEAAHGDLGMIQPGDAVLAISRSGDSRELYAVLDYCRSADIPLIAVTAKPESPLGKAATVVLRLPEVEEVCPIRLAPTTSTLITLALGDVLAVQLMERRSFAEADFAAYHPGGRLGRGLSTIRRYIDEHGAETPSIPPDAEMATVIGAVASGRKGCVVVLDPSGGALLGIITEGDLRRAYAPEMFSKRASDVMTKRPVTLPSSALVRDAVAVMTERRIANIVVVDDGRVVEILDTKDLMQRGYL
ncbi:MAG: KpsF/GutQ family sugar-phosphate isomerase [Bauldia sp.]|nr:KpsF/GutQ family sugar-phosphate isomerase [Bauldia sp.]